MQTTSHFIGITLKSGPFLNIFSQAKKYIRKHNLEGIVDFQDSLNPHITLYYLEQSLSDLDKNDIKKYIQSFNLDEIICIGEIRYFLRSDKKYVLYFDVKTKNLLNQYRDFLHCRYKRDYVLENNFDFTPHITYLKINNVAVFEKHRERLEAVIREESSKLDMIDVNTKKTSLYAVDSRFSTEKQMII